jgi:hypothetical protein
MGEQGVDALRVVRDGRLKIEFLSSKIPCGARLLAYRELDDALGLAAMIETLLQDQCTGRNAQHTLVGLLRQSVFGRLAGYEDTNDAEGCTSIRHGVNGVPGIRRIAIRYLQSKSLCMPSSWSIASAVPRVLDTRPL